MSKPSEAVRRVAQVLRCPDCGARGACYQKAAARSGMGGEPYTNGYLHASRLRVASAAIAEFEAYQREHMERQTLTEAFRSLREALG